MLHFFLLILVIKYAECSTKTEAIFWIMVIILSFNLKLKKSMRLEVKGRDCRSVMTFGMAQPCWKNCQIK